MGRYAIPLHYVARLEERFDKLQRRADRLEVEAPVLKRGPLAVEFERKYEWDPVKGEHYVVGTKERWFQFFEVEGDAVKVAGWSLAAVLDWPKGADAPMIRNVPGSDDIPKQYREWDRTCEHCGTRRYRKQLFVVRHEDGTCKAVGRSCLKDHLGHRSPDALARYYELVTNLVTFSEGDCDDGFGPRGEYSSPDTREFLAWVASCVDHFGWWSKAAARESWDGSVTPTAESAIHGRFDYLYGTKKQQKDAAEFKPTPEHFEKADKWIEWVQTDIDHGELGDSDYAHNLKVAMSGVLVEWRFAGIIASVCAAYRRAKEREIERAERQREDAASEWVGEKKERLEFDVTVAFTRSIDSDWGGSLLLKMKDASGNLFTWFASSWPDVGVGDEIRIRGTVKDHTTYNGAKETQLTRCKIIEAKGEAA